MLEAAKDIQSFTNGIGFNAFENDKKTRYAVERQLLVIGEAANHISTETQESFEQIPWRDIIGLRNIIAHEYGEIISKRIWNVAKDHIPQLIY
ncbi:MAG: DUF86 domain-containing protein, partial [Spirochaetales bacterium]|nr:DUF86 domain-containing protein [Spirochaetales bacterium]